MENNDSIALRSKFETIDFETGELVNVLDSSLSVKGRVDTAKWLIDRFNSEIELCKQRKFSWNEREEVFKFGIERIRQCIQEDMVREGYDKIKTMENTIFLTDKSKLICTEHDVPKELKVYDITLKNLDYEHLQEVVALAMENDLEHSYKDRIEPVILPDNMKKVIHSKMITFRKSPKSNN
ncbi:MAG: siphovirus Gp157 family protein [bacterium]